MRLRHRVLLLLAGLLFLVAVAIVVVASHLLGQVAAAPAVEVATTLAATERLLWLAAAAAVAIGVGLGAGVARLWWVAPLEHLARGDGGDRDDPDVTELAVLRQRLRSLRGRVATADLDRGSRLAAIEALLQESATRLAAADRLALTGQLALGAAHDLGSPLAIAVACVDSLRYGVVAELEAAMASSPTSPGAARTAEQASRYVDQIDAALGRVDAIVRELNAFGLPSRSAAAGRQEVARVAQVAEATVRLARLHRKCRSVRLTLLGAGPIDVPDAAGESGLGGIGDRAARMPPRHLEQILLNLIINAADATANQGRVTLELGHCADAGDSNGSLTITVRDDGPGVPDGLREQLFEPFFTTKAEGLGSGLGLAVSRRLAEAVGGELRLLPKQLDATAGAADDRLTGAAFELRLPAAPWSNP